MKAFYREKRRLHRKFYRELFYMYMQPGRGKDMAWRWRFGKGKHRRKHVINRVKVLMSWYSREGNDIWKLSDQQVMTRLLVQFGHLVNYYKGEDYHEFIMYKFGEIDLD